MKISASTKGLLFVVTVTLITAFILLTVIAAINPVKGQTIDEDRIKVEKMINRIDSLLAPAERELRDQWRALYDSLIVVEGSASEAMRQRIVTRRVLASNQHQSIMQIRSNSNNLRRLLTELRDDLDITTGTDTELGLQIIALNEQIGQLEVQIQTAESEIVSLIAQLESLREENASLVEQAADYWIQLEAYASLVDSLTTGGIPDTVYYPIHRVVDIGFSDTPPEWRRVDRIILRPVGWAAGNVSLKGSDDPRWTDIAIEVSTGDMWGTGDYFMYVNIPTTDFTYAAAMLDSLKVMDTRARTGLQIRQSYEPGSPFVMLAYQNGRASVNMRNEWGAEVVTHPEGSYEVALPIVLQVNMTDMGFDARLYDVWTDTLVHSWSLPNVFEGKFYTGIATTSWRTDYITRAYYSLLNILDAVPWNETCRDGNNNIIDCPEGM